ncbi:MAG: nucleoside triphosphate pyrophosphohydrolase [Firmicutes bacterium]|nr:nucleoside triphosphate pyrophosphohydrolase [Bacillota bacterium]MDH7496343.1 nucleoside triphosphate pyrophosphohydrolase [Bacillota bacterium]
MQNATREDARDDGGGVGQGDEGDTANGVCSGVLGKVQGMSMKQTGEERTEKGQTGQERNRGSSDAAHDEYSLAPLVAIMRRLRGEGGCPWDRKQTHESLRSYVVEEAYEVVQAIDDRDDDELCEELGDLLLQVAFHSQIASESGRFDVADVIRGVVEKLIRRHPHVFGDVEAKDSKTVLRNWERIKQRERKDESGEGSILDNIAGAMPALMRALKVQSKASRVGFDWPDVSGALAKVREEMDELEEARRTDDRARVAEEVGDVLFALVNVARFLKVDPEIALGRTVDKFISRFKHIEMRACEAKRRVEDMTLDEMDSLWEEAKTKAPSGADAKG